MLSNSPIKLLLQSKHKCYVGDCTLFLNLLPPKGGFSTSFRPRTIFTGVRFDYTKHCRLQFGQYVQVCQENTPTNIQASRTTGNIWFSQQEISKGDTSFWPSYWTKDHTQELDRPPYAIRFHWLNKLDRTLWRSDLPNHILLS